MLRARTGSSQSLEAQPAVLRRVRVCHSAPCWTTSRSLWIANGLAVKQGFFLKHTNADWMKANSHHHGAASVRMMICSMLCASTQDKLTVSLVRHCSLLYRYGHKALSSVQ